MPEFQPPFKCTIEEAKAITEYFNLYVKMENVFEYVQNKTWFKNIPHNKKRDFLENCATRMGYYTARDYDWYDAINIAIEESRECFS